MPLEGRGRREEREGRENNSVVGYSPVVAAWLESRSVYHINRYSKAGLTEGGGKRGEGGRASDSSVPQAIYRYTSAKRLASTVASPRARLALFIAGGSLTEYRYSSSSSSSLSIDSASASISSVRLIRIRASIGGGEFISVTSIFFFLLFSSHRAGHSPRFYPPLPRLLLTFTLIVGALSPLAAPPVPGSLAYALRTRLYDAFRCRH